ncbi:MAG: hypothetical protein AAB409_03270 [Gemmatimonadota bacterium]
MLVLTPVGLLFYHESCACLTRDQTAHRMVRSRISAVLNAQQSYLAGHHRYARSFEELGYQSGRAEHLTLSRVADSSLVIEGRWLTWAPITCELRVTPDTEDLHSLHCTGRIPGRLGF